MRILPLFIGLLGLLAAQATQAASYVFNSTVGSSPVSIATLDVTQQGTDALFQLNASFAALSGNPYLKQLGFAGPGPKSAYRFQAGVKPSVGFSSAGYKKLNNDNWKLSWVNNAFTDGKSSTWIIKNTQADLFGSPFFMKIKGLTGGVKALTLTTAAPVPEVSSLSMYVTGLGLVGLVMLRRRPGSRRTAR